MSYRKDPRRNASGYIDMTAYEAIKRADSDADAEKRFRALLQTIFYICELAGFRIENRIELKDKKTGKIWR